MKQTPAVLIALLLALAGCVSPPIPQELVKVGPPPAPEPMSTNEVVRLSQAGVSDDVILGLIRSRGVVDPPTLAEALRLGDQGVSSTLQLALVAVPPTARAHAPAPRIVYREFFIPLWPSYAGGRWRVGCRVGVYYRTTEVEPPQAPVEKPRPPAPQPEVLDP